MIRLGPAGVVDFCLTYQYLIKKKYLKKKESTGTIN